VEQLAAILQHAAEKLPHKGAWLKGRVEAAALAVPPSRTCPHRQTFRERSQLDFERRWWWL